MKLRESEYMTFLFLYAVLLLISSGLVNAQEKISLTLEKAIDIMMNNSYQIKQLEMGIERSRLILKAERAGLKSKVYMNLETPNLNRTSDKKWNSTLQRNEIVRENSSKWQMDMAVKQPVILFGYPTNGNISINYMMYRYGQSEDGDSYTNYYNRLYLKFEQPLFQPNELKNDIEEAELDLEEEELDFIADQIEIIDDVSDEYYDLFRMAYQNIILNNYLNNLKEINECVSEIIKMDSARSIEKKQIELAMANTNDAIMGNQSELRSEKAKMIQSLRLDENTILDIDPLIKITLVSIDREQALEYGYSLRPSMRLLAIDKRKEEIDFQYVKASNAFKMDLEMTYGLEKQDVRYRSIWNNYDNSNSITLSAFLPIWDWGRRKARIEAGKVTLKKLDLDIEEKKKTIKTQIINAITNLNESQNRVLKMQESIKMAEEITGTFIEKYRKNEISLQDILQIVIRQKETEENFLNAYLDYRKSILALMISTYFNYENNISLLDELRSREGNK